MRWAPITRSNLGGFDPPIQHHPYGHSTANRVPAVGRNKIDLDFPALPPATDATFDSHVGEPSKTLLARDTFIPRESVYKERERERERERKRERKAEKKDKGRELG